MRRARAFAPASVGNTAVAFDVMGFTLAEVGDRVTVSVAARSQGAPPVVIDAIRGVVTDLPMDPARNTAAVALRRFAEEHFPGVQLRVEIDKGIPLCSGMGGSAASAVGAVVAANALLGSPLAKSALLPYALEGEALASGSVHTDNVAPSLFGGVTFAVRTEGEPEVVSLPTPKGMHYVLAHPRFHIDTMSARAILKKDVRLADHIRQSALLGGFIIGCYTDDLDMIGKTLADVIIEPQRAGLIPGFYRAKEAALGAGALGFSIAGAGPSVFAFTRSLPDATRVRDSVLKVFATEKVETDAWVAPINEEGAKVIETGENA